jgi:hypothetical protein
MKKSQRIKKKKKTKKHNRQRKDNKGHITRNINKMSKLNKRK